jgi:hypothetical protein
MRWNLILDGGQSVVRFVRDWFRSAQTTRSGPVSDQLSDYAPEAAVSDEPIHDRCAGLYDGPDLMRASL